MAHVKAICTSIALTLGGPAFSQVLPLTAFVAQMNLTEVTFSGRIKFDESSLNDFDFVFYDAAGEPFPVTVDAGRKVRERIQSECKNNGFLTNLEKLCKIDGTGTVEIRGSRIHLSIDSVTSLKK